MKFVADTKFLSLGGLYLTSHFSVEPVNSLIRIDEFLVVVGFEPIRIVSLQQVGEEPDKFGPLFRSSALPMCPERTLGHLLEIEAAKDGFAQPFSTFLPVAVPLELRV